MQTIIIQENKLLEGWEVKRLKNRLDYYRVLIVDILVKFNPKATLFDFVGLGNYLEEKLKIKVDVVSERGIRPELKGSIVKDVVRV